MIAIQRIYEPVDPDEGYRVLVDRLWPRGVKREVAALDWWAKAVTPSNELRLWYGHDSARWEAFQVRYGQELLQPAAVAEMERLADIARERKLILLTGAKSPTENHVLVLRRMLLARL